MQLVHYLCGIEMLKLYGKFSTNSNNLEYLNSKLGISFLGQLHIWYRMAWNAYSNWFGQQDFDSHWTALMMKANMNQGYHWQSLLTQGLLF